MTAADTIKYLDLKAINAACDADIRSAIDGVLRSGWYLKGEATRLFIGTRHCVGCGNGLDALSLILAAYKEMGVMSDGDEVLVPANTFIASVLAITQNGLTPVFVEPHPETLEIDESLIEQSISRKTRALMIVHLYGRCAYTPRIADICRRHGLKLIEDNAQAHGCRWYPQNRPPQAPPKEWLLTGSLGDAAGHSFYPGKNLGALGDAGAVTTDDDELSDVVRALGNYGSRRKYVHEIHGRNSRMDELQAAVLSAKLPHLESDNEKRKAIARVYINNVCNPLIRIPHCPERDSVWHIFPVFCEQRDSLQRYLAAHGVETQVHYPVPPHRQGCYAQWNGLQLPVSERLSREELSLPCHQLLTTGDAERIASLLNAFRQTGY